MTMTVEVASTNDDNVQYEDDRVKLTDNELILKAYTNNEDHSLYVPRSPTKFQFSDIDHVSWSGAPENQNSTNGGQSTSWLKKKTEGIKKKLHRNDKNGSRGSKKAKRRHSRFVVVTYKENHDKSPAGYGFSVTDPETFNELLHLSLYPPEEEEEIKVEMKKSPSMLSLSSLKSVIKRVSSKENFLNLIKGNSSDNLKRLSAVSTVDRTEKEDDSSSSSAQRVSLSDDHDNEAVMDENGEGVPVSVDETTSLLTATAASKAEKKSAVIEDDTMILTW